MGIMTDSTHTKARIQSISAERIRQALDEGKIVIAAGFQGVDPSHNITTLGRGGSDTTAVALAAVLHADSCEIYTDVDGVYTTDPRLMPGARRVKQISYDEMLELASAGAAVMHSRSIEFAKKFGVPVHVRSSFSDQPGTMIVAAPESPDQAVCGAAMAKDEARVTVLGVPDRPGAAMTIFSKIAAKNIATDMIVQNVAAHEQTDISFTVVRDDLPATLKAIEEATRAVGAQGYNYDDNLSKISVVGAGMKTQPGVAQKMFRALADKGINILMITTSEIKISVLVDRESAVEALRTVHAVFGLDKEPPPARGYRGVAPRPLANNTADVVARMQGMEDLIIEDIALDETQSRVTMVGVPDRPGLAAQVFEEIAAGGIVVNMIVQSVGREDRADLSFTVPQTDLASSLELAGNLAATLGCRSARELPQRGQALGFRDRNAEPYGHGPPPLSVPRDRRHQRRYDQYQRGAAERRHRPRPGPQGAGIAQDGIRRRHGIGSARKTVSPFAERKATLVLLLSQDVVQHLFVHEDRERRLAGHRHGNGIGGTGIDLDQLAVLPYAELGVVGVLLEFADDDVVKLPAQLLHDADDQIVSQRPGRRPPLDAAVDLRRLGQPDEDGKLPRSVDLLKVNDLIIADLADDDPGQFHGDGHG